MRAWVLAAWAASPARFREDANAEEDAALGSYRDRLVVELVQNAVDAAAPGPARVLFRLRDDLLEVANTGAPLSADGVQALVTMRASAKRGAFSLGRFGVGFAAALAVSDEPAIVSGRSGGVRWSRRETLRLAGQIGSLADELERRSGAVPVLRLPFPYIVDVDGPGPPPGYDTLVRLPLREPGVARALLAAVDPTLPLVAAGLTELTVDCDGERRLLTCSWDGEDAVLAFDGKPVPPPSGRWLGVTARGRVPSRLLADRPVEERVRDSYEIRAMSPQGRWPVSAPRVFGAPQPTDEALSLPLVLTAPLPVEPSRRHTVPGALRDFLLDRAAEVVVGLAERLGSSGSTAALELVPVGLAHGATDAYLRHAVARLLPQAKVLPPGVTGAGCAVLDAGGPGRPVARPSGRSWEENYEAVRAALTGCLEVLPSAFARPGLGPALDVLGVRRLRATDVVEALAGLDRPPARWAGAYVALAAWADAESLGALPVPLADDRVVTGPREVLLPTPAVDVAALARAGLRLRIAAPAALAGGADDVLRLLGARDATADVLLDHPALRDAVEAGVGGGADEPGDSGPGSALAGAVLPLVGAAGLRAGERQWLSDLPLPDAHGQLRAAGDLVLPGGALDRVLGTEAPVGRLQPTLAARWPRSVLAAVGVLDSFPVVHAGDVHADPHDPGLPDLAGAEDWVRSLASSGQLPASGVLHDVVAIADLDLVADDRWPEALRELATPPLRDVLLAPGPSYTRWWLGQHAMLPDQDGVLLPAPELCTPDAELVLDGVYTPVADLGVDSDVLAAAGCRRRCADVLSTADDVLDLLDRVGDSTRQITWARARALYRAAARRLDGGSRDGSPAPPLTVRTADRGVVPTQDAVVVDVPDLLPLLGQRGQLRVPVDEVAAVSRVLGVAVASRIAAYELVSRGVRRGDFVEHDRLLVRDADGRAVSVGWRVLEGVAHVDAEAGPEERGRALALAAGRWSRRAVIIAQLRAAELGRVWAAEADLEAAGAPGDGGAA